MNMKIFSDSSWAIFHAKQVIVLERKKYYALQYKRKNKFNNNSVLRELSIFVKESYRDQNCYTGKMVEATFNI